MYLLLSKIISEIYIFLFWVPIIRKPISLAARSEGWFCGRSLVGIVSLNRAGGMVLCPLRLFYIARYRSLRRANYSSRGVVPSVVCLSVIVKP